MGESLQITTDPQYLCDVRQSVSSQSHPSHFIKDVFSIIPRWKFWFGMQLLIISALFIMYTFLGRHIKIPSNIAKTPGLRFAHCMAGSPRTLYKEEVYVAYRRQTLNILPGDIFAVLQLHNGPEIVHGTAEDNNTPDKYTNALKYLSPRVVDWIRPGDHLGAKEDRAGYAKWQRCLEHIEQAEKNDSMKYDFIVRSRPDLYFAKDLPTPNLLPHDRILINPYYECFDDIPSGYNQTLPDNTPRCNAKDNCLSDLFAIVPRALADPYMRVGFATNLPPDVCGFRSSYAECAIKASLKKANVTFELWPFVVKIMRSAKFCHSNDWNKFNTWC